MENLEQNIMDKSLRSVFVGNIPYEATEEKLKDIFSEVGQVLSFKLVFDRETGKPKGYGFCEYRDQETALSAMRNLNGYEIGGRSLRVDNACTEKSRMEMQNLLQQPAVENPYGEPIQADKAPEAISKAVASLPPEQMFELMKQMKTCVQNNPNEARIMLIQNPQLAFALLQAQVVMRIIDPTTACNMLYKSHSQVPLVSEKPATASSSNVQHSSTPVLEESRSAEIRPIDPRLARTVTEPEIRTPIPQSPVASFTNNLLTGNADSAGAAKLDITNIFSESRDPRSSVSDPRQRPSDPRQKSTNPRASTSQSSSASRITAGMSPNIGGNSASEQEKAALIMQVLQLSDEQISMLPPEQRASILVLKDQIAKNAL